MTNLNLLFYKTYYEKLGQLDFEESVKNLNKQIFCSRFVHKTDYLENPYKEQYFVLKTVYPGLLIGTGTSHGSSEEPSDINLGFSFDYVTGQPFIPGSSVKGSLRSHFKNHAEAVKEILAAELNKPNVDVQKLETEIFDGKDVFFDAVVFDSDESGLLVGDDYITPHLSPIQNPKPIYMLKILPDVRFEFRFILNDGATLGAADKQKLFSLLLQHFGIGAKTNVGYGILCEADDVIKEKNDNSPKNDTSQKIKCPHCNKLNFKYYKDSNNIRKYCFACNKALF